MKSLIPFFLVFGLPAQGANASLPAIVDADILRSTQVPGVDRNIGTDNGATLTGLLPGVVSVNQIPVIADSNGGLSNSLQRLTQPDFSPPIPSILFFRPISELQLRL